MNFPALDRYNEAVQSPQNAFFDPLLKSGEVERTGLGLPRALGGGFAITYSVRSSGQRIAVRCFHKSAPQIEARYQAIAKVVSQRPLSCFVSFEYQKKGVRVDGQTLPIVRMEWVEGQTLGSYLENVSNDAASIDKLLNRFRELERMLRLRGIAHGDLQNGNVIVAPSGELRLVDYDGMYVQGITVNSGEIGHRHFQHPLRSDKTFGPNMDRFSFITIDLSLRALAARPRLFKTFSNGDNILFTGADFQSPKASLLFNQLGTIPQISKDVEAFSNICAASAEDVPTLDDFLAGKNIPAPLLPKATRPSTSSPLPVSVGEIVVPYVGPYPVIDASDFDDALSHVGDMVEVVGQINSVFSSRTKHGKPFVFLNFGDWKLRIVKGVLWSNGLEKIAVKPDTSWNGRWISIIGMPTTYRRDKTKVLHIDIEITDASRFRLIDEKEAQRRLGKRTKSVPNSPASPKLASNTSVLQKFGIAKSSSTPVTAAPLASSTKRKKDRTWWYVGAGILLLVFAINAQQRPLPPQTSTWTRTPPSPRPTNPSPPASNPWPQNPSPAPPASNQWPSNTGIVNDHIRRQQEADERARTIAENERRIREAEENSERIRREAEQAELRKLEEGKKHTLVWEITNNYWAPIEIAYFSQQRLQEWRGERADRKGFFVPKGATRQHVLSCEPGEMVCYGAWLWRIPGNSDVWGMGRIGARKCSDCCQVCGAGSTQVTINPQGANK